MQVLVLGMSQLQDHKPQKHKHTNPNDEHCITFFCMLNKL